MKKKNQSWKFSGSAHGMHAHQFNWLSTILAQAFIDIPTLFERAVMALSLRSPAYQ